MAFLRCSGWIRGAIFGWKQYLHWNVGIEFIQKWSAAPTRRVQREHRSQTHSEGSEFWARKTIGAIWCDKPTLYTKKQENSLSVAKGLNDDKTNVLVQPQKVLGCSKFIVCEFVISMSFTGHHKQDCSSLHRGPSWAQTRPLLRTGQTSRFSDKYITYRKLR